MADPLNAFVMSEWLADRVADLVEAEELAAVPGQVECGHKHGDDEHPDSWHMAHSPFLYVPCPSCGAVA